jgi:hypothetical protein
MNPCHKIAMTLFSFGIFIGSVHAQESQEEKPAGQSRQQTEEETRYVGYGRRMRRDASYDNYCDDAPCSDYRRANRMSHHDRKMLRQQVNEAGRTLYPQRHH